MVRLAIVGTGGVAGYHAEKFAGIAGCRVVAGCDVDGTRAAAFAAKHAIPRFFTDAGVMLKECALDAVVVSTPDRFHAPVSLQAIRLGKHVLCEKPLALDHAEAAGMVRAARRAGVINMVHFTYRNAPAIQRAHAMVAAGELGDVTHVDGSYLQSWLIPGVWGGWRTSPGLAWRLSSKHSMGVLGDLGVHLLDFASYTVGGIRSVNVHLKTFTKIKGRRHGEFLLDANDTALMQVEFRNGALGMLHTTRWAAGHLNTVQLLICGTRGALRLNLDRGHDKLEVCNGDDLPSGKWQVVDCPKTPTIGERFIKSIRTGVQAQPDFARGAEIQKVLDACLESNATGTRVKI